MLQCVDCEDSGSNVMRMLAGVLFLCIFSIGLSHAGEESFYPALEKLEEERLDNLSETKERLEKFSQSINEFSQKELELYKFISAHSKIMDGNLTEAEKVLSRLTSKSSSPKIRGRSFALLGVIYRFKGDNVNSFISIDSALKELDSISEPRHRSAILANTVTIYRDADLLEFALEYARRLLSEANKIKLDKSYCLSNLELGGIETLVGNFEIAKQRVLVAKEYCKKLKTPILHFMTIEYLVKIYLHEGKLDDSFEVLEEHYSQVIDYGWDVLESTFKSLYAETYLLNGEAKKALPYAKSAYKLSSDSVDFKRKEEATRLLAKIYDELGDEDNALKFYKEYMIRSNENKTKIRQRKLAFDIAKRGKLN